MVTPRFAIVREPSPKEGMVRAFAFPASWLSASPPPCIPTINYGIHVVCNLLLRSALLQSTCAVYYADLISLFNRSSMKALIQSTCYSLAFIGLLHLSSAAGMAQESQLLWEHTYGGEFWESAFGGTATSDGGALITGYTESFGAAEADLYLVKINADGDTAWTRTYGGPDIDEGYAAAETNNGGFVVAGEYRRALGAAASTWLLYTDMNGDTVWTRTWDSVDFSYRINAVQVLPNGDILLAGGLRSMEGMPAKGWLSLVNSEGAIQWSKFFAPEFGGEFLTADITQDGGFALAGYINRSSVEDTDGWLVRTNMDGEEQWSQNYGGGVGESFAQVFAADNDSYVCIGITSSIGEGPRIYGSLHISSARRNSKRRDAWRTGTRVRFRSGPNTGWRVYCCWCNRIVWRRWL